MARIRKLTIRPDSTLLGQRLNERMTELGLDDRKVSETTGLSFETVRSIRRLPGTNPTVETVTKLARTLGVTSEWLMGGLGDNSATNAEHSSLVSHPLLKLSIQDAKDALARYYNVSTVKVEINIKGITRRWAKRGLIKSR